MNKLEAALLAIYEGQLKQVGTSIDERPKWVDGGFARVADERALHSLEQSLDVMLALSFREPGSKPDEDVIAGNRRPRRPLAGLFDAVGNRRQLKIENWKLRIQNGQSFSILNYQFTIHQYESPHFRRAGIPGLALVVLISQCAHT